MLPMLPWRHYNWFKLSRAPILRAHQWRWGIRSWSVPHKRRVQRNPDWNCKSLSLQRSSGVSQGWELYTGCGQDARTNRWQEISKEVNWISIPTMRRTMDSILSSRTLGTLIVPWKCMKNALFYHYFIYFLLRLNYFVFRLKFSVKCLCMLLLLTFDSTELSWQTFAIWVVSIVISYFPIVLIHF